MKVKGVCRYWDLGRNKAKGEIRIETDGPLAQENCNVMMRTEFGKHLMSQDISFDEGKIFAGFRTVGNYEFIGVSE